MTVFEIERIGWLCLHLVVIAFIEAMEYKKTLAFLACVIIAFVYWLIAY